MRSNCNDIGKMTKNFCDKWEMHFNLFQLFETYI